MRLLRLRGSACASKVGRSGIRSFTTSPYVFTTLSKAHALTGVPSEQANFYLVTVAPGANVAAVKRELASRLHNVFLFTKEEFRQQNINYWLFGTGAGAALLGGRAAWAHRGHGYCRPDPLFEHKGPFE